VQQSGPRFRIAIVDESDLRAAVVEEGLREAGLTDIVRVPPVGSFVSELEKISPDVVIFDLGSPTRDTLEEMLAVSRALARPIAMFVDQSDEDMTAAAIDAGVSAYVVDGLRKDRVKPILDLAIRRFNAFANLQKELHEAKTALAERRVIDKAKLYLMSTRKLNEADAYALLRGTAMRQSKRIADIAQALLTAAELLEGQGKENDPQ
jgi:response regulator NasT